MGPFFLLANKEVQKGSMKIRSFENMNSGNYEDLPDDPRKIRRK